MKPALIFEYSILPINIQIVAGLSVNKILLSIENSLRTIGGILKKKRLNQKGLFALKVVVVCALTITSVSYLSTRYVLGIDTQIEKCIPEYSFYLIDKWDSVPHKGHIFAFYAHGLSPIFEDGRILIKYLQAVEGDEVDIQQAGIFVNRDKIGQGLPLANQFDLEPSDFYRKHVLKPHEYWLSGTSESSFDSRYFGVFTTDQIMGRAYPIW